MSDKIAQIFYGVNEPINTLGEPINTAAAPFVERGGAVDCTIKYTINDSGQRQEFTSGMVRDVTTGKIDYTLALDGPMFERWAIHLTKGAAKYAKRNWMKADDIVTYDRFRESALRHFMDWYHGKADEDHASACFFNLNGAEFVKEQLEKPRSKTSL